MEYIKINEPFKITGICSLLARNFEPSFVFLGESHYFWEFFAVISGEVEVVENEKTYVLSDGDIIFHAPDEFHRLKSSGGTRPRTITFSFLHEGELPLRLTDGVFHLSDGMIADLISISASLGLIIGEDFDSGVDFEPLLEIPYGIEESKAIFEAALRLTSFLISVSKLNESEGRLSSTPGACLYRNIVKTMTERVAEGLTVEALAELHHISRSYIKKLFRAYAGESPSEYYSRLRIKEAKRLLSLGKSVSEAAELLNFSSAAYFSSYFKKCTGERATDFKKKYNKHA